MEDRRAKRIREVVGRRQSGFTIVLEDIHDPHNAEAILRTCDAFGIHSVHFIFEKEKYYNPKRVGKSTSSSANKWLDFTIHRSTRDCISVLHNDGYVIAATTVDSNTESLFDATFSEQKIAIVVGNEHSGISDDMLASADRKIAIPMHGMVQSLNVSVTAAIILFEITRQRAQSSADYLLSDDQQQKIIKSFLEC